MNKSDICLGVYEEKQKGTPLLERYTLNSLKLKDCSLLAKPLS